MSNDLMTRIDRFLAEVPPGDTLYRSEAREYLVDARVALEARDKEIMRLNKWADGFSDAQLKERHAGEEYQREWEGRAEAAEAKVARLRETGSQASNVCYILAQAQRLEDHQRDAAQSAYKKWDAALAALLEPDGG